MESIAEEKVGVSRGHGKGENSLSMVTCVDVNSDDESVSTQGSISNELAYPANFVQNQTKVGTFGEVRIENSQDVHFGNKIFAAPITVVNAVGEEQQDKLGILEKKSYWQRFVASLQSTSKRERIGIGLLTFLVLLIAVVVIIITTQISNIGDAAENTTPESAGTSAPYNCLIPRAIWGALPPNRDIPNVERDLPLVIILHTATPFCKTSVRCQQATKQAQNYHMFVEDYGDVGYNFLVGGDGFVYEGRGWGKEGAHTKTYNRKSIGISFIGNYHNKFAKYDTPTPDQLRCTQTLLDEGVELGWLAKNYSIVGYCDLKPGIPPGNVLLKEIRKWPHYRKEGNPGICID